MAHITEITIEGLLGRKDPIHLTLNRGVNVFFGENGCGKTTLLKVLHAALSQDGAAMERLPVARAEVDIYSIDRKQVYRHSWERAVEPQEREGLPIEPDALEDSYIETTDGRYFVHGGKAETDWTITPNDRQGASFSGWSHKFLPTTRLYLGDAISMRSDAGRPQVSEAELDRIFKDSINRTWLLFYSTALTNVRDIQESGLRTVLQEVLAPEKNKQQDYPQDVDTVYARVASFLARHSRTAHISLGKPNQFRERYETDAHLRQIVNNLDHVERQIEMEMVPINRFLSTISRLFSGGKSLRMESNVLEVLLANDHVLPISQLSSGEKHLIKILLTAMTCGPNSILIDEPELSMHIDWQRAFVETISSLNPKCQLILASHSPEIMADLQDSCIFRL